MSNRLLFNEDGKTLDEIVFTGMMHLEQEDDDAYYLAVYDGNGPNAPYALFNLYAEPYIAENEEGDTVVKVRLVVSERDMGMTFPVVQRHKTSDEWKVGRGTDWYVDLSASPDASPVETEGQNDAP